MALTSASIFSEVIVAEIQDGLLENMRNRLVYGNPAYAEMGRMGAGSDAMKFASIPDLAVATTPLTEGSPPTAVALDVTSVTVDTQQYGNLVTITDLARVKTPFDLISEGRERLSRNAAETVDELVRDEIALSGTAYFAEAGTTTRAGLDSDDLLTAAKLKKLAARMFYGKVPKFDGENYLLIVSPGQAHDLRTDTATGGFIDTLKYTNPRPILTNEIGTIGGFRVIEAQNAPTFSSSVTVHAAFALGGLKGWGWGDLQTLRAYHTPAGGHGDELHQTESLGWKQTFGVAGLSNARYFRVESAATDITANNA